ncbi:hypothetical protein E2C01_028282 [Portunus trituberculatus]|uniref:Uncharacterized protein n=1 Tax=Portunus trituberculatus TaxID=210409 RepID=A0A5B7ENX0_PORTR|nr:hypothetical protein [Portunus trituberculatus]
MGAYTIHLVQPVLIRASHFTPSTSSLTIGRALVTDSLEKWLVPEPPPLWRFPGTRKQYDQAAHNQSSARCFGFPGIHCARPGNHEHRLSTLAANYLGCHRSCCAPSLT